MFLCFIPLKISPWNSKNGWFGEGDFPLSIGWFLGSILISRVVMHFNTWKPIVLPCFQPPKKRHSKAFFCFEFVTSSKAMATNGYDEESVCQVTQAGQIICCLTPPRSPLKDTNPVNTHYIRCIWGWFFFGDFPDVLGVRFSRAQNATFWGHQLPGLPETTQLSPVTAKRPKNPVRVLTVRFIGPPYFPLDSLFNRDPYNG